MRALDERAAARSTSIRPARCGGRASPRPPAAVRELEDARRGGLSRSRRAVRRRRHGTRSDAACASRARPAAARREPEAVWLRFRLTRGCFATAVLRELFAEATASGLE